MAYVPPYLRGILPPEPEPAPPEHLDEGWNPEPPPEVAAELEREAPAAIAKLVRYTAADIARPLPKLDYLVPRLGLVSGGGAPHMFAGYGFSGKTLALQVLLLCLASGRKVWGAFDGPAQPIRVSHVDAEQGEALTFRRYQRAALGHGIELELDCADRLNVFVMPKLPDGSRLQLTSAHKPVWRDIMDGSGLVVIDSLAALSGAVDENSREQRAGLDLLGELSEDTKCRALVVHHATKPPNQAMAGDRGSRYSIRGSGAIYDALDGAYVFSGEKGESVKVEHVKARSHGEPTDDFALSFGDVEKNGDAKAGVTCTVYGVEVIEEQREAERRRRATLTASKASVRLREVLARGPADARTLRGLLRMSGDTFHAVVGSLGGEIVITDVKEGRAWRKIYRLAGH